MRQTLRFAWRWYPGTSAVIFEARVGCFDPIAEASELPKHSGSALLLGLFGHGRATFLITDPLVQDQPDQPTLSMGNRSDSLIMSQVGDRAAIHDFEDASLGPGSGV